MKFFITTPIYYSNDVPHIWHAYSTIIADTYSRFKRLLGYEVKFSTWVDENSQKIVQKAQELWKDVYEYIDEYASKHIAVRDALDISYTDFIRTTWRPVSNKNWKTFQYPHPQFVQDILQKTHEKNDNDIYQDEYEWLYCVWCESFKKESDLIESDWKYPWIPAWEKICPDHPNRHLEKIKEKNRFFNLPKYQEFLETHFQKRQNFVIPENRFHEVQAFVKRWLDPFSISREGKSFWIQFPFDKNSVTYVRYDALFNYVTVCQEDKFRNSETEKIHVLWKDISRFHAIYRPAMLHSVDLPLPDQEIITGFFTIDWQKMSKSLWNVINPTELVDKYGRDALVFYLLYDIPIWSDWDFSTERFHNTYEAILCNWWWNLVNRVVSLCAKNWITEWKNNNKSVIAPALEYSGSETKQSIDQLEQILKTWKLKDYLDQRYQLVQKTNEYIQTQQPRAKLKDEATKQDGVEDLQFLLRVVKQLWLLSAPILTQWFSKLQNILWNTEISQLNSNNNTLNQLRSELLSKDSFQVNLNPEILYNRVEISSNIASE